MIVKNGQTDVTTYFVLRDSTNHAPKTDCTVGDIDLYYVEEGAAISAKADASALAAADSAHSDNKAFHVGQGLYRIDWPDEAFNGGVGKKVILIVVYTGVDTTFLEVELSPKVDVASVSDDATAADNLELMFDGTGYAGGTTKLDVNTATIGANAITATAINADAITAAKIADNAIDLATFAADCKTGSALKANVETVTNGAITAAAIATGAVDADSLAADAVDEILDEVVEGTTTFRQAIRLILSIMTGKSSGGGTATITFRDIGDTKDRVIATVDANGNRTAIGTRDGT